MNKFIEKSDLNFIGYTVILKELENIYCNVFKKKAETFGEKYPNQSKIHWSRDWEYPWAIVNSKIKKGDTVLDCGCGGSPLLPLLASYGCQAYGIDLHLFTKTPIITKIIGKLKKKPSQTNSENNTTAMNGNHHKTKKPFSSIKALIEYIKRPNNLWGFNIDPNKLGFPMKLYEGSLTKMPFEDNFFDKLFCMSVIEHLPEKDAYKGMKEMARVLKKNGRLTITIDNDGPHVTPELVGKYQELINASGLLVEGNSDFEIPKPADVPGNYNVLGIILKKQ